MTRGYVPKTIPAPLLVAVALGFFLVLIYLVLLVISRETKPVPEEKPAYYETYIPYGETAVPQPEPRPTFWQKLSTAVRQEKEIQKDTTVELPSEDFATQKELEKIKTEKDFRKMQQSL
jgi:hypothetical protein